MLKRNRAFWVIIGLLMSVAVFILTFFLVYNLACAFFPPYIEEASGEQHPVMPIGQVIVGLLASIIACIISLYVCYRRFKKVKL